jgi:glycosyltransferase involved in cell wall biosynthesis
MAPLTVLICTHNRAKLLARALDSLNAACFPAGVPSRILVVANACRDDTLTVLQSYRGKMRVSLDFLEEPKPGKSHALNTGLAAVKGGIVAFVDDDHRVDPNYPLAVWKAFANFPEASLVCGRIVPDWTGEEPAWVHNETFFPIYPLPVPRYDQGQQGRWIGLEGPLPGGGNLAICKEVFDQIGGFSPELGPKGHDLGGSEDSEFVLRALKNGFRLRYAPEILQYHYVDLKRLTLWYIMKKAYKRSQTVVRYRKKERFPPRYLYRKAGEHSLKALFSLYWPEKRYWLVRAAAALGELSAYWS